MGGMNNGGYPSIGGLRGLYGTPVVSPPFPSAVFFGGGGYPRKSNWRILTPEITSPPFPDAASKIIPGVNQGYPVKPIWSQKYLGAFANAAELTGVVIPESVKYIGWYAFRNTKLVNVTVAADCVYYPTSFPDGCTVSFYQFEANFVTSDGMQIRTADGFIFNVKEE